MQRMMTLADRGSGITRKGHGSRFVVLVATTAVLTAMVAPAAAVVVCQKGRKAGLRVDACRKKEVTVADLGGNLAGIWKHREGNGLVSGTFVPTFLTLNADGTGSLNLREPASQVLACEALRYARGGGTPTLTLKRASSAGEGGSGAVDVVQATLDGADALRITDDAGTSVFDRAAAVDISAACGTLTETRRLTNVPVPFNGRIGLAFDGTSFIYLNDNFDPVLVDAATGAPGTAPTLDGNARVPFAVEGADLWGLCRCGADERATRSSRAGAVVDSVVTTDLLGTTVSLAVLAVPTPGQLLLLTSEGRNTFKGRLLLVSTAAVPHTLLSAVDFDVNLRSMAHDGTTLWGLLRFGSQAAVVRIDPATGRTSGTFQIADTTVGWLGLAAGSGQLFVVGTTNADGKGVIATFSAPAP